MTERTVDQRVVACYPALRRRAIVMCRKNADRAEDLVQETMLRAYEHPEKLAAADSVMAWLAAILRNLFLDDLDWRRRQADLMKPIEESDWATEPDEQFRTLACED